jgi:hypothetical protein
MGFSCGMGGSQRRVVFSLLRSERLDAVLLKALRLAVGAFQDRHDDCC